MKDIELWLGYNKHYILTHPWVIVRQIKDEVKWAYQRVFRGWDDRAVWSIDSYLSKLVPELLIELKLSKGTPLEFMRLAGAKDFESTKEQDALADELWHKEIDKMIAGFVASEKMNDCYDKEKLKILEKVFKNGMESFVEYYGNLWT